MPAGYEHPKRDPPGQAKRAHLGSNVYCTRPVRWPAPRGDTLLLLLDSGLATFCPPGETGSGPPAGTQPARDSSVDGALKGAALRGPRPASLVRGPASTPLDTRVMPPKIPGVWGQSPQGVSPFGWLAAPRLVPLLLLVLHRLCGSDSFRQFISKMLQRCVNRSSKAAVMRSPWKHLPPFAERQVAGQQQAFPFIAIRKYLKKSNSAPARAEGQIAQLVPQISRSVLSSWPRNRSNW